MPRNKMAREKVQVTSPIEAPKVSMMGRTKDAESIDAPNGEVNAYGGQCNQ